MSKDLEQEKIKVGVFCPFCGSDKLVGNNLGDYTCMDCHKSFNDLVYREPKKVYQSADFGMDKVLREMVDLVLICGDLLGIDVEKEFPTLYQLFKRGK